MNDVSYAYSMQRVQARMSALQQDYASRPELPAVSIEVDVTDALTAVSDASLAAAGVTREMIWEVKKQTEDRAKDAAAKARDMLKNQAEANKLTPAQKALEWIGKIATVIGAMVGAALAFMAAPVTGGASILAGGAAVIAVIGAVSALVDMGMSVAKEAGADVKSNWMEAAITACIEVTCKDESKEQQQKRISDGVMGLNMAVLGLSLLGGAAGMIGARMVSKAVEKGLEVGKLFGQQATELGSTALTAAESSITITSTVNQASLVGINIVYAHNVFETQKMEADHGQMEAMIEMMKDWLDNLVPTLNAFMQAVLDAEARRAEMESNRQKTLANTYSAIGV